MSSRAIQRAMNRRCLIFFVQYSSSSSVGRRGRAGDAIISGEQQRCNSTSSLQFVPKYNPPNETDLEKIREFVARIKALFVLSGAGISTESGIPDYRSEGVGLYAKSDRRPIQFNDFMTSAKRRQMYWARNYVSWPHFSSFAPNLTHKTLAQWERRGKIRYHVSQNVDSLLIKAGCLNLTELHGSSYTVRCLDCSFSMTRDSMQLLIAQSNPNWSAQSTEYAPDNDVVLSDEAIRSFVLPCCPNCRSDRLKPDVVFFGESIPANRTMFVNEKLSKCDGFLAIGTSLEVYSAYRLALRAKEFRMPIAIINIGKTRADKHADLIVNSKCSDVLTKIDV